MFRWPPNSHIINKSGSVLSEIVIETSAYRESKLVIYFKENADPTAVQALQDRLREIGDKGAYIHNVYCIFSESKVRQVIDILFQNQYISVGNRADLEDEIRKAEKNLAFGEKTTSKCVKSQQEVIGELISPYLEDIVSISTDHRKVFTLMQYAFSRNFQRELKDIIKLIKSCDKNNNECKETLACINHLKRICWGEANLESTYERLGTQVPSLSTQRKIVADACLKILNDKFELSIEDRFFYAAEIIMMTCLTQHHIEASHTKEFLDSIFRDEAPQRKIFYAFTYLAGFNNVVLNALLKSRLSKEETQILIDNMQSKVLLDKICIFYPLHKPERVAQEVFNARVIAILNSDTNAISLEDNAKKEAENISNTTDVDNRGKAKSYPNNCSLFSIKEIHSVKDLQCKDDDSLRIRMCHQSGD